VPAGPGGGRRARAPYDVATATGRLFATPAPSCARRPSSSRRSTAGSGRRFPCPSSPGSTPRCCPRRSSASAGARPRARTGFRRRCRRRLRFSSAFRSSRARGGRRRSRPAPRSRSPLVVRRVVVPSRRVAEDRECAEPDQDHRGAADLAAADALVREPPAEREREHDRRHEERLDHGEPPVGERDGLEAVAAQQRDRPEQPPRLFHEVQERPRRAERKPTEVERSLLLERCREREEERRHEREDLGHGDETTPGRGRPQRASARRSCNVRACRPSPHAPTSSRSSSGRHGRDG